MELKECYEAFGGNYDEVKRRLMKDERIEKFLFLFLKDENYNTLEGAVAAQDWDGAFRAAHTLKGVTMNLSLDRLSRSAAALTEMLRGGAPAEDIAPTLSAMEADYRATVDAIRKFQAESAG